MIFHVSRCRLVLRVAARNLLLRSTGHQATGHITVVSSCRSTSGIWVKRWWTRHVTLPQFRLSRNSTDLSKSLPLLINGTRRWYIRFYRCGGHKGNKAVCHHKLMVFSRRVMSLFVAISSIIRLLTSASCHCIKSETDFMPSSAWRPHSFVNDIIFIMRRLSVNVS